MKFKFIEESTKFQYSSEVIKMPASNTANQQQMSDVDKQISLLSMHERRNVKKFGNMLLYTGALLVPLTSCIIKIINNHWIKTYLFAVCNGNDFDLSSTERNCSISVSGGGDHLLAFPPLWWICFFSSEGPLSSSAFSSSSCSCWAFGSFSLRRIDGRPHDLWTCGENWK